MYKSSTENILLAMEIYGGSFVKQLAILYRHADNINKLRIVEAFDEYFKQYDKMAAKVIER